MSQSDSDRTSMVRTTGPQMTRRNAMRAAAAGAGAIAFGASTQTQYSPVGTSEAVLLPSPDGWKTGRQMTEWYIDEIQEWMDQDDVSDELSGAIIDENVLAQFQDRESQNRSTIIDNINIAVGLEHVCYQHGKLAAIEALEEGKSESDTEADAIAAVESHGVEVQQNLLRSWEESMAWLESNQELLFNNGAEYEIYAHTSANGGYLHDYSDTEWSQTFDVDLIDGETFQITDAAPRPDNRTEWNPVRMVENSSEDLHVPSFVIGSELSDGDWEDPAPYPVEELRDHEDIDGVLVPFFPWNEAWEAIEDAITDARDGIILWVDAVYDDIQSGDLELEEILVGADIAEMLPEDEDGTRGMGDLLALNMSVNFDRELQLLLTGGEWENSNLYGTVATSSDTSLSPGDTIDPSEVETSFFIAYDVSEVHGEWDWYDDPIDGGTVTLTREPYSNTEFHITTIEGETVAVDYDDFAEDDTEPEWTVDIGSDLEDPITEVEEIHFYNQHEDPATRLLNVIEPFEVVSVDGETDPEEVDSVDYESPTEFHSDDNYLTVEEFESANDDLVTAVDELEDAVSGDNGGLFPGFGELSDGAIAAGIIVVGIIIAALGR